VDVQVRHLLPRGLAHVRQKTVAVRLHPRIRVTSPTARKNPAISAADPPAVKSAIDT